MRKNAHEKLRVPDYVKVESKEISEVFTIYESGEESIRQYVGEIRPGKWSYGYRIMFQGGRVVEKQPGDILGWFMSPRDAKLYFLGYICKYRDYFSTAAVLEVKKLILEILQMSLFIN